MVLQIWFFFCVFVKLMDFFKFISALQNIQFSLDSVSSESDSLEDIVPQRLSETKRYDGHVFGDVIKYAQVIRDPWELEKKC